MTHSSNGHCACDKCLGVTTQKTSRAPSTKVAWIKRGLVRPPTKPITPEVLPTEEQFTCTSCNTMRSLIDVGIRCRILRGYRYLSDGLWRYCDTPHPDHRCYPMYGNGRVCKNCAPKYHLVSTKPTTITEMQFIRDVVAVAHSNSSITTGNVALEDALDELASELIAKAEAPVSRVGRIVGPALESTLVAVKPVDPMTEIDTNAFRRFMMNRKGGVKDYHANPLNKISLNNGEYDAEVNYDNIKRG